MVGIRMIANLLPLLQLAGILTVAFLVIRNMNSDLRAWVNHNIIADDPNPQLSKLDHMDGLE